MNTFLNDSEFVFVILNWLEEVIFSMIYIFIKDGIRSLAVWTDMKYPHWNGFYWYVVFLSFLGINHEYTLCSIAQTKVSWESLAAGVKKTCRNSWSSLMSLSLFACSSCDILTIFKRRSISSCAFLVSCSCVSSFFFSSDVSPADGPP